MIIGTYSGGGSASANEYSTLPELLSQLPDNSGNLIDAVNVRNSVYTLWQRVSQVQTVASQSASASTTYTNLTPTPASIGGIPSGSTFSNKTMSEMWDALLYPYIAPSISLGGGGTREFGASNTVSLSWTATKGSKNVTSIIVCLTRPDVESVTLTTINTSGNQSGTKSTTSTQNSQTTFFASVSDIPNGTSTVSASTTVSWSHAIYWGTVASNTSIPQYSGFAPNPAPSWANGASVGSGKSITSTFIGSYNGIDGGGNYLVFAWPTSYGTPKFKQDGLTNTAWTKIGSAVGFINMYNYNSGSGGHPYDIWISDTAYNSPVSSFSIELGP